MSTQQYEKIMGEQDWQLKEMSKKSKSWFRKEITAFARKKFNRNRFIIGDSDDIKKRIQIGRLYMFRYAAKGAGTLPVWDEYPLVLPFSPTAGGFIGINLHYLPYKVRAWLLHKLLKVNETKQGGYDPKKKMRVSWEILNGFSRYDVTGQATHQYLYSQMASPFKLISTDDYQYAIMLPMAKWQGTDRTMRKLMEKIY